MKGIPLFALLLLSGCGKPEHVIHFSKALRVSIPAFSQSSSASEHFYGCWYENRASIPQSHYYSHYYDNDKNTLVLLFDRAETGYCKAQLIVEIKP